MSNPGLIIAPPKPIVAVRPELPGTIPVVTPSGGRPPATTAVASPSVPSVSPPNVNSGEASFSGLTGSINDLLKAKQAEISSSVDALKANTAIDTQTASALQGIQTETLGAFHNIERAQSLPGGVDGKLAKIISIFDSDYNVNLQRTRVEENQLRATQITGTADNIKLQNNALPAIMAKITDATQAGFNAQRDANQLAIQAGTLQNEISRTAISRAQLVIALSAERRQQVEFAINSMSTDQIAAQFDLAKQGKGQFKDAAGLLEHRLVSEKAAEVSLHSAQTAAANGDRDAYNSNASDFVSHLPAAVIRGYLDKAQKSGQSIVTFNIGVDPKTKQPQTLAIPIPIVQQGLVKNAAIEQQANATVAADDTQRLNLIPNATALIGGANGLASVDPRASSVVTNTTGILQGLDPKNPNSVRQTAAMLDNQKALLADIAKSVSDKFSTPEAKAAVNAYGVTGRFDNTGGAAVVVDSIGIPLSQTLYRTAWGQMNTMLANGIKDQHNANSGGFDPNKSSDVQAMINGMMQKPDTRFTMRNLAAEILSNPTNQKQIAGAIAGVIRPKAMNDTLAQLANVPHANPIWKDIIDHPEQMYSNVPITDKDGKVTGQKTVIDYQKMFERFEKQSVQTGGKVNFADTFIKGLRDYAVNSDNSPTSDPRYTIYDHALEAAVFGSRPHSAVLADLVGALAQQAARAHADMQRRIQQDLSGATQRQAIQLSDGPDAVSALGPLENVTSPAVTTDKNLSFKLSQVPSATGTGMTADQIKRLYGGAH